MDQIPVMSPHQGNGDDEEAAVIIIGAGAAGLTAAYDLHRKHIPFRILEAHSTLLGGRMRKLEGFADYPIDVGGEWIHVDPSILDTIVDDADVDVAIEVGEDDMTTFRIWQSKQEKWKEAPFEPDDDLFRFKSTTWFDFFNDFIAASFVHQIKFGCVVDTINYSAAVSAANDEKDEAVIKVTCQDGRSFFGTQVIVTVGIRILQSRDITFVPPLPTGRQRAIEKVTHEPGMKVFIEFSKQFYFKGAFAIDDNDSAGHKSGDVFYWNESTHKKSTKHILGVFIHGTKALDYVTLDDDQVLKKILGNLDSAFDGQASACYVQHFVQNWTHNEPFVRGTYTTYRNGMRPLHIIQQPIERKIFFAGEASPPDGQNYGFVHGAALSGRQAVQQIERVRSGKNIAFNAESFFIYALATVCCGLERRLCFREEDD